MLLSFKVLSIIFGIIWPSFHTLAVLLVVEPLSHVCGAVCMSIGSVSVCFVISPLSFIDVTICMHQFAKAIGLVRLPLTLVLGAIRPYLMSVPIFHSIEPLSSVYCSTWESQRRQRFTLTFQVLFIFCGLSILIVPRRCACIIHFPWYRTVTSTS